MLRTILNTRDEEIGCDDCLDRLGAFVESETDGKVPSAAFALVQQHLDTCPDCHEEYEALRAALGLPPRA